MTTLRVVRSIAAICLVFMVGLFVGHHLPPGGEATSSPPSSCCSSHPAATAGDTKKCGCKCYPCPSLPDCKCCAAAAGVGWRKGPLSRDTYNWGGIITEDIKNTGGFWMADFRGDHVLAYKKADDWVRVEPKDVLWYSNSLTLPPPPAAAKKKVE